MMVVCHLFEVQVSQVGLVWVGLWVRVDSGGGCPRPWEKQGLRLGLGMLTLVPDNSYVPHVLRSDCPR